MSEMWQNSHIYHSGNLAECSKGSFQQMAGFGLLTDIWTYYTLSFKILVLICSHQRSIHSPQPTLGNTPCLLVSETCNMLPTLFLMLGIMDPQALIMLNAPSCCKGSWQVLQTKGHPSSILSFFQYQGLAHYFSSFHSETEVILWGWWVEQRWKSCCARRC